MQENNTVELKLKTKLKEYVCKLEVNNNLWKISEFKFYISLKIVSCVTDNVSPSTVPDSRSIAVEHWALTDAPSDECGA